MFLVNKYICAIPQKPRRKIQLLPSILLILFIATFNNIKWLKDCSAYEKSKIIILCIGKTHIILVC